MNWLNTSKHNFIFKGKDNLFDTKNDLHDHANKKVFTSKNAKKCG